MIAAPELCSSDIFSVAANPATSPWEPQKSPPICQTHTSVFLFYFSKNTLLVYDGLPILDLETCWFSHIVRTWHCHSHSPVHLLCWALAHSKSSLCTTEELLPQDTLKLAPSLRRNYWRISVPCAENLYIWKLIKNIKIWECLFQNVTISSSFSCFKRICISVNVPFKLCSSFIFFFFITTSLSPSFTITENT